VSQRNVPPEPQRPPSSGSGSGPSARPIPTPTTAFTKEEIAEKAAAAAAAAEASTGAATSKLPALPPVPPHQPTMHGLAPHNPMVQGVAPPANTSPPLSPIASSGIVPAATALPPLGRASQKPMPPPMPLAPPPARSLSSGPPGQASHPPPLPPLGSHPPPASQAQHAPAGFTTTGQAPTSAVSVALRTDMPREVRPAASHVVRSRAYAFVLDARGLPIEIGSGRFAKAFLGEERWLESKTDFRRYVVIKMLQRGVSDEDRMRFQIEKELLERVQGHPNIITLFASGESDDPEFIPLAIRDKVENDFVILERLDMSLEERLKGTRARGKKDDLLACDMKDRLFRVLDYMIPVASAVEYAHLVRNICHRDIKPANILVGLPDTNLRGSTLEVRLADFNVAKLHDDDVSFQVTQLKSVPGTLFFQSPEQEMNVLELLVNVQQGSPEVEFFEDFYIQIAKNDAFALYNRGEQYQVLYSDRAKKRIVLDRPYKDVSETNVRAKVQKSVGRPADIYSLGALFYYLISGAYANPKTLYDAFHKFIEYEQGDENNTIEGYLAHEYSVIDSLRAPKAEGAGVNVAPADRFFSYKHYLDGNGELIDPHVMKIIAKCMIRNKPDSYCQPHEIETRGISDLVQDLVDLYSLYGFHPGAGSAQLARRGHTGVGRSAFRRRLDKMGLGIRRWWMALVGLLGKKKG